MIIFLVIITSRLIIVNDLGHHKHPKIMNRESDSDESEKIRSIKKELERKLKKGHHREKKNEDSNVIEGMDSINGIENEKKGSSEKKGSNESDEQTHIKDTNENHKNGHDIKKEMDEEPSKKHNRNHHRNHDRDRDSDPNIIHNNKNHNRNHDDNHSESDNEQVPLVNYGQSKESTEEIKEMLKELLTKIKEEKKSESDTLPSNSSEDKGKIAHDDKPSKTSEPLSLPLRNRRDDYQPNGMDYPFNMNERNGHSNGNSPNNNDQPFNMNNEFNPIRNTNNSLNNPKPLMTDQLNISDSLLNNLLSNNGIQINPHHRNDQEGNNPSDVKNFNRNDLNDIFNEMNNTSNQNADKKNDESKIMKIKLILKEKKKELLSLSTTLKNIQNRKSNTQNLLSTLKDKLSQIESNLRLLLGENTEQRSLVDELERRIELTEKEKELIGDNVKGVEKEEKDLIAKESVVEDGIRRVIGLVEKLESILCSYNE